MCEHEGCYYPTGPSPAKAKSYKQNLRPHHSPEEENGLWKAGNINEILLEGRCIQERLPKSGKRRDKVALVKSFLNLMSRGKVNKSLRLLSSNSSSGVLSLDDLIPDSSHTNSPRTICEILVEKHPPGKPASTNILLQGSPMPMNPILFENLNAKAI